MYNQKKVIAVIVTRNRRMLLKQAIIAIFQQSYPVEEIIIVDNASTDSTEIFMKSLQNFQKTIVYYSYLKIPVGQVDLILV